VISLLEGLQLFKERLTIDLGKARQREHSPAMPAWLAPTMTVQSIRISS
jgi:hypothetical protein